MRPNVPSSTGSHSGCEWCADWVICNTCVCELKWRGRGGDVLCIAKEECLFSTGKSFSVLTLFTWVKVPKLQCALLQVIAQNTKHTWIKVWKFWHHNLVKVPKVAYKMFENSRSTSSQRVAPCRSAIFKQPIWHKTGLKWSIHVFTILQLYVKSNY